MKYRIAKHQILLIAEKFQEIHFFDERLSHIFVVGGFGESPILRRRLFQLGEKNSIQVTIPLRPGLAVVQGSVLFGLRPESITSRRSRYTYGKFASLTLFYFNICEAAGRPQAKLPYQNTEYMGGDCTVGCKCDYFKIFGRILTPEVSQVEFAMQAKM